MVEIGKRIYLSRLRTRLFARSWLLAKAVSHSQVFSIHTFPNLVIDRSCFTLPSSSGIQFSVINEGKTGALLDVQKPTLPSTCVGVSFPQTHYEVYFTRKNAEKVKHIRSFTERIHVENGILDKETDYEVRYSSMGRGLCSYNFFLPCLEVTRQF